MKITYSPDGRRHFEPRGHGASRGNEALSSARAPRRFAAAVCCLRLPDEARWQLAGKRCPTPIRTRQTSAPQPVSHRNREMSIRST